MRDDGKAGADKEKSASEYRPNGMRCGLCIKSNTMAAMRATVATVIMPSTSKMGVLERMMSVTELLALCVAYAIAKKLVTTLAIKAIAESAKAPLYPVSLMTKGSGRRKTSYMEPVYT